MSLLLIVLLPFLGAVLPALMIRSGRDACAISAASINLLALVLLLTHAPAVFRGESPRVLWRWVEPLGLNLSLHIDGLGLLFAALILGIGLLVVIYSRFYLGRGEAVGNFYTYLLLFQGAMVGIVLSNNVLLLLVFWELTSLASFLLIGFWGHTSQGRQGARMALAVTGSGGLALIAGMLLVGRVVGSYELTEILASGDTLRQSPQYRWALGLILIGCFTKSAQFPFHFWLPHAMAAPTPVSAYLHSATMVKAGVFLLARMWPVMSGTQEWFDIVTSVGLITMLIGAVIALFQEDLKGLLAYSTVSHLGLMTMLLGISTPMAAAGCVLHIINHAAFKASLFMNAGIIDHETGTRDLGRLGGLLKWMPITAGLAMIAAASMAGLPPMGGFLSKEWMLEEAAHTKLWGADWTLPLLVTVAAIFSFAYSLRYVRGVFFGPRRDDSTTPHDPKAGLWLAPAVLAALAIAFGLFPEAMLGEVVRTTTRGLVGGAEPKFELALWHGPNMALAMSLFAVVLGSLAIVAYRPVRRVWRQIPLPEGRAIFDWALRLLSGTTRAINELLHGGSLRLYLTTMLTAVLAMGGWAFYRHEFGRGMRPLLEVGWVEGAVWGLLMIACGLVVVFHRQRLVAVVAIGAIGLVVSLAFVRLSAPDLAITQIAVEVVTLILMLLALYFLPKRLRAEQEPGGGLGRALVSIACGLTVGWLGFATMTRDFESIAGEYWRRSLPEGGGANVVNVIIVDFRGFDTYGEIMVLGIAALIIFGLISGMMRGPLRGALARWTSGESYSPSRHPLLMVVVTRLMLPLSLIVAAYLFVRGHQMPGGGFIAALVVSIALIMQYMASGFGWAEDQISFDYHALIGGGALVAGATGIAAMALGHPFLTSGFGHFHLPLLGDVELASAMAFDLGVFLTVVGGVMLALAQLSNLGECTRDGATKSEPMDYPHTSGQGGTSREGRD